MNDLDPLNDGLNQFSCSNYYVYSENSLTVMAENNWWQTAPPDDTKFYGVVDYNPYLFSELPEKPVIANLEMEKYSTDDLLLKWIGLNGPCRYRVFRSEFPDSNFFDISGLLFTNEFVDNGALLDGRNYYYKIEIE